MEEDKRLRSALEILDGGGFTLIFELNIRTNTVDANVYCCETKKFGTDLVRRIKEGLQMPDLDLYKIEDTVVGGSAVTFQIDLPESPAYRCPLFGDTNIGEVFITNNGLNHYMKIGYEISNNDATIYVRPDFKTLQVNHNHVSDIDGFTCKEIRSYFTLKRFIMIGNGWVFQQYSIHR